MAEFTNTVSWLVFELILTVPSTLTVLMFFLMHFYYTTKKCISSQKKSHIDPTSKKCHVYSIIYATLSALIFYSILITFILFEETFHVIKSINTNCNVVVQFGTCIFVCAKTSLYSLLILRLYVAYYGSSFAYSNKVFIFSAIIIATYFILGIIFGIFEATGKKQYVKDMNGNNNKVYYWCPMTSPEWLLAIHVVIDFMANIILTGLFIKPLKLLIDSVASPMANKSGNADLEALAIKYTIIAFITCFTSVVFMVFVAITKWAGVLVIDWAINSVCAVLMSQRYNKIYEILCRCCIVSGNACSNYRKKKVSSSFEYNRNAYKPVVLPAPTPTLNVVSVNHDEFVQL